jgi:signal transduction histidine kinase
VGRWQGRLAWGLCAVTFVGIVVNAALLASAPGPLLTVDDFLNGFPIIGLGTVAAAAVGALIVSRQPNHRIGRLFSVGALGTALNLAVAEYGVRVLRQGDLGPVWAGRLAIWAATPFNAVYTLTLLAILLLLVPDGRLPSRRWRPVLVLPILSLALHAAAVMSVPPAHVSIDASPDRLSTVTVIIEVASEILLVLALPAAGAALIRRLRAAHGEQRQQLRWIATSAVGVAVGVVTAATVGVLYWGERGPWIAVVPLYLAYLSVPLCTGLAILRYRLYDIDVIINRAVVLAVLALFVTAGYVAVVVVIGAALGRPVAGRFWPSLAAIAVVALAFQPLRSRLLRWADRLVYGERAVPYEALAEFSHRIGAAASPADLLPLFARAAADSVGARRALVHLEVPGTSGLSAIWPEGADGADERDAAVSGQRGVEFVVAERGERMGVLAVTMPPGRALRRDEQRLLEGFTEQAGLALRNVRLDAQLQARVAQAAAQSEALEQSRRRLLGARDAERQRVAATINRTVLSRLEPLVPALESQRRAGVPGAVELLGRLDAATSATLDALREITRGLFPAVLSRRGLAAALRAHLAAIGAVDVLRVQPVVERGRFAAETEAAGFFCCLAGLADLARPASVELCLRDGMLVLDVAGPAAPLDRAASAPRQGAWFAEPLLLADRVEAAGGWLRREYGPDGTLTVHAELPAKVPSPA